MVVKAASGAGDGDAVATDSPLLRPGELIPPRAVFAI